ncbi:hypothetical protein PAXRUDRAFT_151051 [Paxillus rubicundulus Ve08.2h10]|uniref:Uncharacterized protein n=1 Tax=Paxillus rubicundulus Ve08.2h10 TaxID=930991 RepID=A0A0D0DII9_9AGAM|nr:hypothetical protein PAXRUDRAFT_151051 [Paxillus rubicundulus Ve08.2h10]
MLIPPQFLEGFIEHTPDIYLTELQPELEEACGIRVDAMTVSHTLHQRGLSRKQVSKYYSLLFSVNNLLYSK